MHGFTDVGVWNLEVGILCGNLSTVRLGERGAQRFANTSFRMFFAVLKMMAGARKEAIRRN